jgi:hypothetical protein
MFFPLSFIVILKVVMHLQIHSHFIGITRYNIEEVFKHTYAYPDEDFCIFYNFPHEKLIYPVASSYTPTILEITCTCTLWFLLQYMDVYDNVSVVLDEFLSFKKEPNQFVSIQVLFSSVGI